MKIRRIASSVAIAAAIVLGASGCGLIAPQGTTEPYAPSDGIDVDLAGVDIRNMMLIADESGENFNVVFTGVNNGDTPVLVRMTFVPKGGSTEAVADFELAPGLTPFGNPEGEVTPILVPIKGAVAGGTVNAYFEVAGGGEVNREVPVLDGTLAEYKPYVLSARELRLLDEKAAEAEAGAKSDAADQSAAGATTTAPTTTAPTTEPTPAS